MKKMDFLKKNIAQVLITKSPVKQLQENINWSIKNYISIQTKEVLQCT